MCVVFCACLQVSLSHFHGVTVSDPPARQGPGFTRNLMRDRGTTVDGYRLENCSVFATAGRMSDLPSDRLATCLQLSKTFAGRQELLDSNEFSSLCDSVLRALASGCNDFAESPTAAHAAGRTLVLLRVLRNCCAAGSRAAQVVLHRNLHQSVVQFAAHLAARQSSSNKHEPALDEQQASLLQQEPLLLAAVQLLANICVAAEQQSLVVWQAMYARPVQQILCVKQGSVHEAIALAMLACLRSNNSVLEDLVSPAASSIWLQLLSPLSSPEMVGAASTLAAGSDGPAVAGDSAPASVPAAGCSDNLCLLVKAVTLQHGQLQRLMKCLQLNLDSYDSSNSSTNSNGSGSTTVDWTYLQPNIAHAVLLHVVAAEVSALPPEAAECSEPPRCKQQELLTAEHCLPWLCYLVALLKHMWAAVASSDTSSHPTVAAYVLEATLQVLQAAVSREDAGRALVTMAESCSSNSNSSDSSDLAATSSDCIEQLHVQGLVHLLLDMLKQLGAPPKRQQQGPQLPQHPSAGHQSMQQQQFKQAYVGYRADLIATLSSFLHGRRRIQDEVLAAGGVEVLLNNCNLDDTAPLAREWALWSIRNMCQGNEAVQQYITQFQAVDAVQSKDLDRLGMELQLDKMNNKLKLVEKPKQQS